MKCSLEKPYPMHWQLIRIWIIIFGVLVFTDKVQSHVEFIDNKTLITNKLENNYITSYDTESFFNAQLSDAPIELGNIDLELLNATLFFTLNKKRTKGRKKKLRPSDELFKTCKYIVEKYSGNSLKRFRSKKNRIQKLVKKACVQNDFNGTYTDVVVDFLPLLNIREKQKYVYNNKHDDDLVFFFPKRRKSTSPQKPIPNHTYQSWVEKIISRSGKMNGMSSIRNKGFSEIGCYISIEQRTPRKIPYAKMIWIVGGYRLNLLEED